MNPNIPSIVMLVAGIAFGAIFSTYALLQLQRKRLGLHWLATGDRDTLHSGESVGSNGLLEKYHRLRDDHQIQQTILDVAKTILIGGGSTASVEESFALTLTTCQKAFGGEASVIEIYEEDTRELVGVATDRKRYQSKGYFRIPLTEKSLSGLAFTGKRTISIRDVETDSRVSQRIRLFFDARSGIATPLMINGAPIGVLMTMMQREQKDFSLRDHALIEGLASIAALAVQSHMVHRSRAQLEYRFKRLVESAPAAILVVDEKFDIQEANTAAEALMGHALDALIHRDFCTLFSADTASDIRNQITRSRTNEPNLFEGIVVGDQGQHIPVEITASAFQFSGARLFQIYMRDLSAQKNAERALAEEKIRAEHALRSITDAVIITDSSGRIERVNSATEKLLEMSGHELRTTFPEMHLAIFDTISGDRLNDPIAECGATLKPVTRLDNIELRREGRDPKMVEISCAPIIYPNVSTFGGVIAIIRDVTQLRRISAQVDFLATHDANTGLTNRAEFERRLGAALRSAKVNGHRHTLCYIDLDRFTLLSETGNQGAGEEMLRQLIPILRKSIREIDTFARIGGDEFALLLERCSLDRGKEIAQRLRQSVREFEFFWENSRHALGASIGVVEISENCSSAKDVLHTGYAACHDVKKERGGHMPSTIEFNHL